MVTSGKGPSGPNPTGLQNAEMRRKLSRYAFGPVVHLCVRNVQNAALEGHSLRGLLWMAAIFHRFPVVVKVKLY
jgi:hypothetical protein